MKRLKNWFIGDYLAKTSDVFERARIELLYNYCLGFIFFGLFFYLYLIFAETWYHFYVVSFAVVALTSIPFLLKYTQNVRLVANWYTAQQVLVGGASTLVVNAKPDMTAAFWIVDFILLSFFLYGRKWGFILITCYGVVTSTLPVIQPYVHVPPGQELHPAVALFPLALIILVVQMFIKTRSNAERQIERQKTQLEQKNKEVTDSIVYAERIQKAILPSQQLVSQLFPDSFLLYLPKDIVSGDFYWVERKKHKVFVAIGDCTGHGVPGAMMSVIGQNALNRVLNEFNLSGPAKMLDKLNELVQEAFAKSGADIRDGMDISLCCFDYTTRQLEFAGANNNLYYVAQNELLECKADKQPIGRFESKVSFTSHSLSMNKTECFYLFTDGIADQFGGPKGKKFKYKRVKELLLKNSSRPLHEQRETLLAAFREWKGLLEQVDDICVFGFRIPEKNPLL